MFSGNPITFRELQFIQTPIQVVCKFKYLKAQLPGNAAKVIEGFPLSDGNYMQ